MRRKKMKEAYLLSPAQIEWADRRVQYGEDPFHVKGLIVKQEGRCALSGAPLIFDAGNGEPDVGKPEQHPLYATIDYTMRRSLRDDAQIVCSRLRDVKAKIPNVGYGEIPYTPEWAKLMGKWKRQAERDSMDIAAFENLARVGESIEMEKITVLDRIMALKCSKMYRKDYAQHVKAHEKEYERAVKREAKEAAKRAAKAAKEEAKIAKDAAKAAAGKKARKAAKDAHEKTSKKAANTRCNIRGIIPGGEKRKDSFFILSKSAEKLCRKYDLRCPINPDEPSDVYEQCIRRPIDYFIPSEFLGRIYRNTKLSAVIAEIQRELETYTDGRLLIFVNNHFARSQVVSEFNVILDEWRVPYGKKRITGREVDIWKVHELWERKIPKEDIAKAVRGSCEKHEEVLAGRKQVERAIDDASRIIKQIEHRAKHKAKSIL